MKALTVVISVLWMSGVTMLAQGQEKLFQQMTAENKEVIEALVLYPEEVRNTIFKACQYPEVLVKLDLIQTNSKAGFQHLVKDFNQKKQLGFYDLSRYPELVEQLVMKGTPLSRDEIREVTKSYPQDIQKLALRYGRSQFEVLAGINKQRLQVEAAFVELMSQNSAEVQEIFKSLVSEPDVLSILTTNIKMAVLVGDLYQNNPQWLNHYADSLNLQEARRNAQQLEEWRSTLSEDPRALAEMEQAAKDFARENAFELEDAPSPEVEVIYRPYPYWFGYPYWYTSPWWYAYPYWYHTGYYIDAGGAIVIVGLPSFYYSVWFYNTPRYYSHWRSHWWTFYDRYPYSRSGLVRGFRVSESYNPRIRRGPRTSREYQPDRREPGTIPRVSQRPRTGQRVQTREAPRTTRPRVQRERANDYHRQQWNNRSIRERKQPQRQNPSRKKRTDSR